MLGEMTEEETKKKESMKVEEPPKEVTKPVREDKIIFCSCSYVVSSGCSHFRWTTG